MSCYNIFNLNLTKFTPCLNKYTYMKKDFDNLILKYLSIYNEEYSIEDGESTYYKDIGDEYQPHMDDIHRHEDELYQQEADAEEYDAPPEICPGCDGDMYSGKCVTCNSDKNHEDNESESGEGKDYYNDISHMHEPKDEYLEQDRRSDMRAAADYDDRNYDAESPSSEDCSECENEGCVDKDGRCHYCDPEDEEPESGREYGENELPPPPPSDLWKYGL